MATGRSDMAMPHQKVGNDEGSSGAEGQLLGRVHSPSSTTPAFRFGGLGMGLGAVVGGQGRPPRIREALDELGH